MSDVLPTAQTLEYQKVLRNVAEDIKTPLLRIAAQAQLANPAGGAHLQQIEANADAALRLLDSYIISTQIYNGQQQLALQPVSVAAVMHDTVQYLNRLARLQGCELEVRAARTVGLAMANTQALQAALTSLGYSFILSLGKPKRGQKIVFTVKQTGEGIQAGVYGGDIDVSAGALQQARKLKGAARQLMPNATHTSGAGIVIADTLFGAMSATLKQSRRWSSHGLSATLLPSHQLALL